MQPGEFELYGQRFRWSDEQSASAQPDRDSIGLIRARGPFPSEAVQWLSRGTGYVPSYGKLGEFSAYQFEGVAGFLFPADGRYLKIFVDPAASHAALEFVLFRGVIPRLLHLQGVTSLHASAIAVEGGVVAFCGPSGAGKSTLAAAMASRGMPLVSDDVVPLRMTGEAAAVEAWPGLPELRIFPAMAERLGISDRVGPPLAGQTKARWQPKRAPERPLPLLGVYLLDANLRGTVPRPASLLPLSPPEALMALVTNSYWVHPRETAALGSDLLCLGSVLRSVPVQRLVYELSEAGFDAVEALVAAPVAAGAR